MRISTVGGFRLQRYVLAALFGLVLIGTHAPAFAAVDCECCCNAALGLGPLCAECDTDGNGSVSISELLTLQCTASPACAPLVGPTSTPTHTPVATPTPTLTRTPTVTRTPTITATPTAEAVDCECCCDAALGLVPLSQCPQCDVDGSGIVSISELITRQCTTSPACATLFGPTSTPTPTPTPTGTPTVARAALSRDISATDTTLPVDDIDLLPDRGIVRIDDELIAYGAKQATSGAAAGRPGELVQIRRGINGTTPAAHQRGAILIVVSATLCIGDCDGQGTVTVDEIIKGVNIALGNATIDLCPALDSNGDDTVTVNELIQAVNAALNGCPTAEATPTATASATPSPVPSATRTPTVTTTPTPTSSPAPPSATATETSSHTTAPTPTRTATRTTTPPPSPSATATPTDTPVAPPTVSATRTPTRSATPTETTASPTTTPGAATVDEAVAGGAMAVANGMSVIPSVIAAIASGFQYGGSAASLDVDGGGIAAGCPQGGTATRTGNIGGTVNISLSNCRLATADGLLVLNGPVSLTGFFTLNTTVDVQATLLDASGTTTRQVASASLTGTIAPQLGGSCYVTGGTFQLSSGTLTNQFPGTGTVTVGFTNTGIGVTVANFSADCVPMNYSLTFNGPASIGVATGAGAAASSSFDVMFSNFTVSQDARSTPTQTQMNGSITSTCFGGAVVLTTRAALTQMAGTACPNAGILRATAAATTDIFYLAGGTVGIDTNLDGASEKTFPSCLDASLLMCVGTVASPTATPTPSVTPTTPGAPTRTATPAATPSATASATPSETPFAGASPTPTPSGKRTATPTPSAGTPSPSPTPTPTRTTTATPKVLYCDSLSNPALIPDNDPAGINNVITITDNGTISDLNVRLDIIHTWIGDLRVTLTHVESGTTATLIDRPGKPATELGCSRDDISAVFDDQAVRRGEDTCDTTSPTMAGSLQPVHPLTVFTGEDIAGTWRLNVSDNFTGDMGSLLGWCLELNSPAPVISEFSCNGGVECVLSLDEPFALFFSFSDPTGDANRWHITGRRDDSFTFEVIDSPFDPPSGSGIVPIDLGGFACTGSCRTTEYDYTLVISDAAGFDSAPAIVHLVVLGTGL